MNSKIFKNSIYLFFRLFITTILVLVSTRIVLDRLGVEDFGIYNVITGAVFLFTFINNAMASSTQRNITFFSEKGTQKEKNEIFNASIRVHFLFSIIAFILLQTIGQILFYYFLNIPEGKLHSAQIAYQCVIFIFFFNIISVPFQAAINSYEDMD